MATNKKDNKYNLPNWCIGGDINQTQNCNVDIKQPNNNVICSNDTNTNQILCEANDEVGASYESDSINIKRV